MANTIKIKRRPASGAAGKPSSLLNGELAFNENDNILYYGLGSGVAGAATSIEQIGGSGYFAHRGGINASGVWPIGITGNSATVTNGVYTTGNQSIAGAKTFTSDVVIGDATGGKVTIYGDGANEGKIVGSASIEIPSATFASSLSAASQFYVDGGGVDIIAPNTSSNSVGYFAVFDSNPSGTLTQIKSVSKDQILDDIGAATSGLDITAGSGLVGGGTLSQNRRFDIGQGDGISVSDNAIAVDSTVVRTTGNQSIGGEKTFTENVYVKDFVQFKGSGNNSLDLAHDGGTAGIRTDIIGQNPLGWKNKTLVIENGTAGNVSIESNFGQVVLIGTSGVAISAGAASSGTHFAAFVDHSSTSVAGYPGGIIKTRTAAQVKDDIGLGNVTNDAQIKKLASTSGGFVPTWNGTTGDALNIGYSVETTLTGGAGALPRADAVKTYVDNMIVSGIATNDAMIFKGAIDCSTNPNYPSGDRGWVYKISVAGKIGGTSGPVVEVNDTIICGTDGTPSGTHAAVGSNWNILQTNIVDASILVTGPSSATSGNIAMFDGATGKIIKDGGFLASNIVLTTGTQTINGSKTFADGLTVGNNVGNLLAGTSGVRFTHPQINFQIDAGNLNPGFDGDALRLDVDSENGTGYITTLKTSAPSSNIILRLPSGSGVLARLEDITTTNITGVLGATKGGTGQSLYAIGDLLYANTTTSLAKLADVSTGNVLLAGGVSTAPSWGKVGLTTHVSGTLPVANGGTNQTSYTNGQLLIGNDTGNTLTKATLTEGTGIDITNGNGSITITHEDTSTLSGAQGSNGIASITVDGLGHVTAVTSATYLTAGTVCAAIVDCTLDGGSF